jgi:hypothetical protein
MEDRQRRLLSLIEHATGNTVHIGNIPEEGVDAEGDADTTEAERTIRAA